MKVLALCIMILLIKEAMIRYTILGYYILLRVEVNRDFWKKC